MIATAYLMLFSTGMLLLTAMGLAVIFGMMRIINLAHGEFMLLGAYACVVFFDAGAPIWLCWLFAAITVGIVGILVERLMMRFLYGRMMDTMLATWGLSLFLVGLVTTVFGPQGRSVSVDFGRLDILGLAIPVYNLLLVLFGFGMLAATWLLVRHTRFGLLARGTIQNAEMADALGVNRSTIYMATFGYGAALTGLAGALLVPLTGASPTIGAFFVAKAFIAVIVGGAAPLTGTLISSSMFGSLDGIVSFVWGSVAGEIMVLVLAVVLLRMLPMGITGKFRRAL